MRTVKKTTVRAARPEVGTYEYTRCNTLTLLDEDIHPEQANHLVSTFLSYALMAGLMINTSTEEIEVAEDEEESFKVKYEKAQKELNESYTVRSDLRKEIKDLETQVATLKDICPTSHIPGPVEMADAPEEKDEEVDA